jgi:aminoglycoside/choline kinase family phosphotransferase
MLRNKNGQVEIISRENFIESSTFPVEIIKCKTGDGNILNLFCKYLGGMGPNNFGHRGGVEYEAKIYESILDNTSLSKIQYYGQCLLPDNGGLLLVIEYLGKALRMLYSGDPDASVKAANWVGTFHHMYESKAPSFVKVYDEEYYSIWSNQFKRLMHEHTILYPWVTQLANYFEDNIKILTEGPQTIIHGEFYPKNILLKNGIIYVADWESTAVAPGEIDLASLIEGWENEEVEKIKEAYKKTRWPERSTSIPDFEKRLMMAQIYFHFWWWKETAIDLTLENSQSFLQLHHLATKAGVV